VLVVVDLETVTGSDLVLKVLDERLLEFLDGAATDANEMIVMGVAVGELVPCEPIAKLLFVRDSAFGEHLHRPIDGCVADASVQRAYPFEETIERHVLGAFEERIDDEPTLLRGAEAAAEHEGLERRAEPIDVGTTGSPPEGLFRTVVPGRHNTELLPP
jgi:hypothetical protein